ncbi:hypothetical protein TNCV_1923231, partial [Trichonephila clavipes]
FGIPLKKFLPMDTDPSAGFFVRSLLMWVSWK